MTTCHATGSKDSLLKKNKNSFILGFKNSLPNDILKFRTGDKKFFKQDFIEELNYLNGFDDNLKNVSKMLAKKLEDIPVGTSFRPIELTHTIRFGDMQFYGNYGNFTATSRAAYERGAKKLGGLTDAEFNVSVNKKNDWVLH